MTEALKTTLNTEITNLLPTLKSTQTDYVIENGKYLQVVKTSSGDNGLYYEVHEAVSNTGIGFTCIFSVTEDSKEYKKIYKYGIDSDVKDWAEVIEEDLT